MRTGTRVQTRGTLQQTGQPVVPAGTTGTVVAVQVVGPAFLGVRVHQVAWATGQTTTVANAHLLLAVVP